MHGPSEGSGASTERPRRISAWRGKPGTSARKSPLADEPRTRRLSRLVPLWPREIEAADAASAERLVAALERALRGERRRGRAGHWTYDINRHVALSRALRDERARLAALRRARPASHAGIPRRNTDPVETKSLPLSAM